MTGGASCCKGKRSEQGRERRGKEKKQWEGRKKEGTTGGGGEGEEGGDSRASLWKQTVNTF